jgi:hypothetical protein
MPRLGCSVAGRALLVMRPAEGTGVIGSGWCGRRGRGDGAWPGRCEDNASAPGAAKHGPARSARGRSSRGSHASSHHLGTRSATGLRSAPETTLRQSGCNPTGELQHANFAVLGRRARHARYPSRPPWPRPRATRWRLAFPDPGGDRAKRLPGAQSQRDLVPIGQRQPVGPGTQSSRRTGGLEAWRTTSATAGASSPPAARSLITRRPWPLPALGRGSLRPAVHDLNARTRSSLAQIGRARAVGHPVCGAERTFRYWTLARCDAGHATGPRRCDRSAAGMRTGRMSFSVASRPSPRHRSTSLAGRS